MVWLGRYWANLFAFFFASKHCWAMSDSDDMPKSLKVLVISDLDLPSSSLLSEFLVAKDPYYDAIIVCGPFLHQDADDDDEITPEEEAVAMGDISTILAQCENIVCRVLYLSTERDPRSTLDNQLHLTPNSVNIHNRRLSLVQGLQISGITELEKALVSHSDPVIGDDCKEGLEFADSVAIDAIENILATMCMDGDGNGNGSESSIFVLNYKFQHTLNKIVFTRPELMQQAGVSLCIVPRHDEVTARLPETVAGINFLVPKSLREGYYSTAIFEYRAYDRAGADGGTGVGAGAGAGAGAGSGAMRWVLASTHTSKLEPV